MRDVDDKCRCPTRRLEEEGTQATAAALTLRLEEEGTQATAAALTLRLEEEGTQATAAALLRGTAAGTTSFVINLDI